MRYGPKYPRYMMDESGILHSCYGKVILNFEGLGTEMSIVAKAGKILELFRSFACSYC